MKGAANGSLYAASKTVDPFNKNLPFANGMVPSSRIDRNMQKLLNIFPLPNAPLCADPPVAKALAGGGFLARSRT